VKKYDTELILKVVKCFLVDERGAKLPSRARNIRWQSSAPQVPVSAPPR
jgi:hypothetical protein